MCIPTDKEKIWTKDKAFELDLTPTPKSELGEDKKMTSVIDFVPQKTAEDFTSYNKNVTNSELLNNTKQLKRQDLYLSY